MKKLENKHLVLEELQRAFDKKFSANDVLDGKLQNILNFLSVIVSIAPTIEASTFLDRVGILFWIPILTVLILYLVSLRIIMRGIAPSTYEQPISNDWNELDKKYFHSTEDEVINLTISQYLYSLELAGKDNLRKAISVQRVSILMGWIVFLVLIAVPLGLIFPNPTLSCFLHLASCITRIKP